MYSQRRERKKEESKNRNKKEEKKIMIKARKIIGHFYRTFSLNQ